MEYVCHEVMYPASMALQQNRRNNIYMVCIAYSGYNPFIQRKWDVVKLTQFSWTLQYFSEHETCACCIMVKGCDRFQEF